MPFDDRVSALNPLLLAQDLIRPEHLSDIGPKAEASPSLAAWESHLQDGRSLREISQRAVAKVEKEVIQEVLRMTAGNKSQAARLLKIYYKTLHYKVKQYGIQTRELLP